MSRWSRFAVPWSVVSRVLGTIIFLAALALTGVYARWGERGLNLALHGSVTRWMTVSADDPRMSRDAAGAA